MTVLAALLLGTALSAFASDTSHVMVEADAAFRRIDYRAALSAYLLAVQESPKSTEGLWKLARIHVLMAEVATGKDQGALLTQAEEYARLCISIDSTVSDGHTWLAASLGYQALAAGSAKKLELAQGLLEESAKALELNPHDDVAYSIRGSFFRALGNASWIEKGIAQLFFGDVPDGGYEESEAALQQALRPYGTHRLFPSESPAIGRDWRRFERCLSLSSRRGRRSLEWGTHRDPGMALLHDRVVTEYSYQEPGEGIEAVAVVSFESPGITSGEASAVFSGSGPSRSAVAQTGDTCRRRSGVPPR
jgi:tetratricopeptide (TPR) repeat protein